MACPWQAVTSTGGTAECSECCAIGVGLKLVKCVIIIMVGYVIGTQTDFGFLTFPLLKIIMQLC